MDTAVQTVSVPAKIERETHKLEKRLCRQVGEAIVDFNMIEEGDRVMVCLENCPETLMMLFACARLGAIHMPINAMAAGPELAWYAQFSGARCAVTQPRMAATLAAHCPLGNS